MDRTTVVACVMVAALSGCARSPRVMVASKNFTEQVLLGEIVAQLIEDRGTAVERKLNLGGTLLAHEALVRGDIDLYPEYTGTALTAILKQKPVTDPAQALDGVREAYRERWGIEWLSPLGFNDTFAMIIRGETARDGKLESLSDAARRSWRLGAGYEFQQRPDGLDGLLKTYGLKTDGTPVAMDLGLLYQALTTRKVDMIAANSTDGQASSLDVVILRDDRHYFPPYECAIVVRRTALSRFPGLRGTLGYLAGKLPDKTMRKLNFEVDSEHRPVPEVARKFLSSAGLIR